MADLKSPEGSSADFSSKSPDEEIKPVEIENLIEGDVEMIPPDGGWGWMIVLGNFLIMVFGLLPSYAFSIIFSPILMSDEVSSTKTAWIYNFFNLIWSIYAILIDPLCEQFGTRKMAMVGGISTFLSMFLSAFAPTANYLFLTYALLGGISGASTYSLTFMVLSQYFKKHLGLAVGITMVGGSISYFLAPILANYLLEYYGYIGGAIIFGVITLNQCVGAMFYQPVNWHLKPLKSCSVTENCSKGPKRRNKNSDKINSTVNIKSEKKPGKIINETDEIIPKNQNLKNVLKKILMSTFNNLKSVKYMRVVLIASSYTGFLVGLLNFSVWIPFLITNEGYSLEIAAWSSSIGSIGNLVGRVLMTLLSDRKFFNVIYGYMFGLFLMGSSIIAFSFVNDIKFYMILSCCFGFSGGFTYSLAIPATIKVMGIEIFPAVLGVTQIFAGLGGIIIGPVIGAVRDATQSYNFVMWVYGLFQFLCVLMWALMPLAEKFDHWKYAKAEKKEVSQAC